MCFGDSWTYGDSLGNTDAARGIDFLNKSVYNYKKASKHPTPEGHALWADYLYNYIITLNNEIGT